MKKLFYVETNHGPSYVSAPSAEAALANTPGAYQVRPVEDVEHQPYKYPETFAAFNIRTLSFHARNNHFPDQMLCISETSTGLGHIPECHYDSLATILFTLYEQLRYHRIFKPGRISISTFANCLLIERDGWIRVVETEGFPAAEVIRRAIKNGETWHIYWEVRSNG